MLFTSLCFVGLLVVNAFNITLSSLTTTTSLGFLLTYNRYKECINREKINKMEYNRINEKLYTYIEKLETAYLENKALNQRLIESEENYKRIKEELEKFINERAILIDYYTQLKKNKS